MKYNKRRKEKSRNIFVEEDLLDAAQIGEELSQQVLAHLATQIPHVSAERTDTSDSRETGESARGVLLRSRGERRGVEV